MPWRSRRQIVWRGNRGRRNHGRVRCCSCTSCRRRTITVRRSRTVAANRSWPTRAVRRSADSNERRFSSESPRTTSPITIGTARMASHSFWSGQTVAAMATGTVASLSNASIQNQRRMLAAARQTVVLGTPITDVACGLTGGVAARCSVGRTKPWDLLFVRAVIPNGAWWAGWWLDNRGWGGSRDECLCNGKSAAGRRALACGRRQLERTRPAASDPKSRPDPLWHPWQTKRMQRVSPRTPARTGPDCLLCAC